MRSDGRGCRDVVERLGGQCALDANSWASASERLVDVAYTDLCTKGLSTADDERRAPEGQRCGGRGGRADAKIGTLETSGRFPPHQRRLLLAQPRIGPRVIERLENMGVTSLEALVHRGVDRVVFDICEREGSFAWANRRRALEEVVFRFLEQ